jgi:D-alanine-D-alanine ligase-like ATP-grasp enzyme
MGWATDADSQQDVIQSLGRADVEVVTFEVSSRRQLVDALRSLKGSSCLVWPNAYQVYECEGSSKTLWLADIIDDEGFPIIGSNASALKNVMLKGRCQQILEEKGVAIPSFASIDDTMLSELDYILQERNLEFPLFTKPNALSSSKGITQDCVVHSTDELRKQVLLLGGQFGYPVMVEEYLPGQDITVAVFMTPTKPVVLATYYDTEIYDDPGAVLDHSVRLLDWNDRKWLRVVSEPEVLAQIEEVVFSACKALNITEFTRIDCRLDRHGKLKAFDINGLPGLELPFSTTVWQMIVKMNDHSQQFAFDTLISLVVYCAAHRHGIEIPARIKELSESYIIDNASVEA